MKNQYKIVGINRCIDIDELKINPFGTAEELRYQLVAFLRFEDSLKRNNNLELKQAFSDIWHLPSSSQTVKDKALRWLIYLMDSSKNAYKWAEEKQAELQIVESLKKSVSEEYGAYLETIKKELESLMTIEECEESVLKYLKLGDMSPVLDVLILLEVKFDFENSTKKESWQDPETKRAMINTLKCIQKRSDPAINQSIEFKERLEGTLHFFEK